MNSIDLSKHTDDELKEMYKPIDKKKIRQEELSKMIKFVTDKLSDLMEIESIDLNSIVDITFSQLVSDEDSKTGIRKINFEFAEWKDGFRFESLDSKKLVISPEGEVMSEHCREYDKDLNPIYEDPQDSMYDVRPIDTICHRCDDKELCAYAFDAYCIDDCLANK